MGESKWLIKWLWSPDALRGKGTRAAPMPNPLDPRSLVPPASMGVDGLGDALSLLGMYIPCRFDELLRRGTTMPLLLPGLIPSPISAAPAPAESGLGLDSRSLGRSTPPAPLGIASRLCRGLCVGRLASPKPSDSALSFDAC